MAKIIEALRSNQALASFIALVAIAIVETVSVVTSLEAIPPLRRDVRLIAQYLYVECERERVLKPEVDCLDIKRVTQE